MKIRLMGLVAAVFALAAIPAVSQATHGNGNAKSHAHSCKQLKLGFTVRGLLDVPPEFASATKTADDISLSEVTSANRHARRSGEVVKGQMAIHGACGSWAVLGLVRSLPLDRSKVKP